MLSPGQFFKSVPKDRDHNLRWRNRLIQACQGSAALREDVLERCRQDILWFTNAFAWTYDPRTAGKSLPFILYPFQEKAVLSILECIEQGRDLVIEKSRDMGASWLSLLVMNWLFSYHPGHSFLMVSRKEGLVDAPGDPDSLFWKVDFIHRHLPGWLLPDVDRRKLHFGNVANGSTIDGESTTAAAGVGGRRTAMFIDEFSRIEEGYQLLAGTADTTNCRIFNFTPFGTSNAAYKLARRGDVRKLRLHWSEHPEKARGLYRYSEDLKRVEALDKSYHFPPDFHFVMDGKTRSPWYDDECKRRANDREVAQMLDIDYAGSASQFFDKSMIVDLQKTYALPPFWEGDISFDADTGRPVELTPCEGGPVKLWLNLDHKGKPPLAPYGGGSDLSTGSGATNSCFVLTNALTGEKVLELASPYLRPEQFALRAVALCWLFHDGSGQPALLSWEMQGPGITFGKKVIELGFRHIYYREAVHDMIGRKVSDTPGWVPAPEAKNLLLSEYRSALNMRDMIDRSTACLEECLSFIYGQSGYVYHAEELGGDDPTGARVNHGDRVIATALSWKMCRELVKGTSREEKELAKGPLPGSLAWRRELTTQREKEAESSWI